MLYLVAHHVGLKWEAMFFVHHVRKHATPLRHSGMTHILKGSHSFTCTPRIHLLT